MPLGAGRGAISRGGGRPMPLRAWHLRPVRRADASVLVRRGLAVRAGRRVMPTDAETILAFVERVEREHGEPAHPRPPVSRCKGRTCQGAHPCDALQAARALRAMVERSGAEGPIVHDARMMLMAGAAALKEGR